MKCTTRRMEPKDYRLAAKILNAGASGTPWTSRNVKLFLADGTRVGLLSFTGRPSRAVGVMMLSVNRPILHIDTMRSVHENPIVAEEAARALLNAAKQLMVDFQCDFISSFVDGASSETVALFLHEWYLVVSEADAGDGHRIYEFMYETGDYHRGSCVLECIWRGDTKVLKEVDCGW